MAILYAFSANQASAAAGSQEVEKTFEFICESWIPLPGQEPSFYPMEVKFSASIPERVKPGGEIDLTNVSVGVILRGVDNPLNEPSKLSDFEKPNFKISSENEANTIHTFLEDTEVIVPPNYTGDYLLLLKPESGVTVGPFIAGNEGEVILKVDSFITTQIMDLGLGAPISMSINCQPPEDQKFILGTAAIDDEAPVITLKGDNPMIVKQGDPYEEPGATATDNIDGDLTDQIEVSGDVDTSAIGAYTVTYTVSDSVGNVATAERTVNVVEAFGSWYTGEGPPSDELGSNGDSYLDLLTGDVYKRDPNTWTKVGNIKGDDGKQGSKIHTGSGAPKADLGDSGDMYFDTKTGDVYEKTADGWVKIANLQGPAGPQGPQGPKGSDGTGGGSGDGDGKGTKGSSTTKGDADRKASSAKGGKLPKTATSLPTLILIGALLAVIGGALFIKHRQAIE